MLVSGTGVGVLYVGTSVGKPELFVLSAGGAFKTIGVGAASVGYP